MKKLLILCVAILSLKITMHASCDKNKNELVNKKDYSVESTSEYKKERYTNEEDQLVILCTYLSPDARLKSYETKHLKDGSTIETHTKKDGDVSVYHEDLHGFSRRIS